MQLRSGKRSSVAMTANVLLQNHKSGRSKYFRQDLKSCTSSEGPTAIKSEAQVCIIKSERPTEENQSEQDAGVPDDDLIKSEKKKKSPKKETHTSQALAPKHWSQVVDQITIMRRDRTAAVDLMGCESVVDTEIPPHVSRFHILVSAMLSSQTKDEVNAAAMDRLRQHGLTMEHILATSEHRLAELIKPVSFFNNKAKYIKQVCAELTTVSSPADIPDNLADLKALPGIGPKMAYLIMTCAWNKTVGICVDIHVHRISNRLGWVSTWNRKKQEPERTREELEQWLPREHWGTINPLLVGFGQKICKPVGPKCQECSLATDGLCPSAYRKTPL